MLVIETGVLCFDQIPLTGCMRHAACAVTLLRLFDLVVALILRTQAMARST